MNRLIVRAAVFGVLLLACLGAWSCLRRTEDRCSAEWPCITDRLPYCDLETGFCLPGPPDGGSDLGLDGAPVECATFATCDEGTPICRDRRCSPCTADDDRRACETRNAQTPRCDTNTGRCVACLPGASVPQSADCPSSAPVCENAGCRACRSHAECSSLVCNSDGTCAPASTVAYVDNQNGTCTGVKPGTSPTDATCTIDQGIALGRPIIRVAGSTVAYTKVSLSTGSLTFIGPGQKGVAPSARIAGDLSNPAISISGASTAATFDGFEIIGVAASQVGVFCSHSSIGPSLTLRRVYIHDVPNTGVSASNCRITIERSQIGPGNTGGGIVLNGSQYSISNNFIVGNATASSPGVAFNSGSTELSGGLGFRNNTVARNANASGIAGVACNAGATDLRDSIIWNNNGGNTGGLGTCNVTNVVTMPAMAPDFVDTSVVTPDFHLAGRTAANEACCIDKVATSPVSVDYDGRARPQPTGGLIDIGAHELP